MAEAEVASLEEVQRLLVVLTPPGRRYQYILSANAASRALLQARFLSLVSAVCTVEGFRRVGLCRAAIRGTTVWGVT